MKKLAFFAAALLTPLFFACNGNGGGLNIFTQGEPTDSGLDEYTTPDLSTIDLHGHVTKVVIESYLAVESNDSAVISNEEVWDADTIEFSDNGKFTRYDGVFYSYNGDELDKAWMLDAKGDSCGTIAMRISRNNSGYLTEIIPVSGDSNRKVSYSLNDNNQVVKITAAYDGSGTTTFEYDADGHVVSEKTDGMYLKESISYKYTKFDKHGNWIERIMTFNVDECIYDGSEARTDYLIQKRVITYSE